jgi:hypothetical protein
LRVLVVLGASTHPGGLESDTGTRANLWVQIRELRVESPPNQELQKVLASENG